MSLCWAFLVQGKRSFGDIGRGENGRGVHGRGPRLGNNGSMNRCRCSKGDHRGSLEEHRGRPDDRGGGDRAKAMADDMAGQTTGIGKGDSQDGSEYSLRRRFVKWIYKSISLSLLTLMKLSVE